MKYDFYDVKNRKKVKAEIKAVKQATPISVQNAQTALKSMQQQTAKAVKNIQERTNKTLQRKEQTVSVSIPPKEENKL